MAGLIDTNILLYAANQDASEHPVALRFLEDAARSPESWYLTEGIAYEFLRVATHQKVFPQPLSWEDALSFLEQLSALRNFQWLVAGERHWEMLREILGALTHPSGNLFFDIRNAALMREHGLKRIYTTDTDFLQFPDLDVINPLRT